PRPFFVRGLTVLGPLSFMVAALIVYWSTWPTLSWLLGLQVLAFALYVLYRLPSREGRTRLLRQVCASLWLIVFFVLVMLVSWAGTFGGHGWIAYPFDTLSVAAIAFFIYHWGARSGLRSDELALEEDDGE
ncbi:aspartate:proton symporter, partial [Xanthomonas oryzae pv. oryzae]